MQRELSGGDRRSGGRSTRGSSNTLQMYQSGGRIPSAGSGGEGGGIAAMILFCCFVHVVPLSLHITTTFSTMLLLHMCLWAYVDVTLE